MHIKIHHNIAEMRLKEPNTNCQNWEDFIDLATTMKFNYSVKFTVLLALIKQQVAAGKILYKAKPVLKLNQSNYLEVFWNC